MNIIKVKDLKWENKEHSVFSCQVNFQEIEFEEWTPIAVNQGDPYPWIQELWTKALNNEYGSIAEYVQDIKPISIVGDSGAVTFVSFMNRLTEDEKRKLVTATFSNPDIKLWYDLALATNQVRLKPELLEQAHALFDKESIFDSGRLEHIYNANIPTAII